VPVNLIQPDLPARFARDAPLAAIDWPNVYGASGAGYIDYPAMAAKTV
jgi:N-ethylmaleimide reductase